LLESQQVKRNFWIDVEMLNGVLEQKEGFVPLHTVGHIP
jgi:hypothetical protein